MKSSQHRCTTPTIKNISFAGCLATLVLAIASPSAQAELIHRYSFKEAKDGAVSDSVGKVNAKLNGDAKIADGKLALDNKGKASNDQKLSYVSFAERILPKDGSATVEAWFTSNSDGAYARLFDFGQRGQGYLFLTVNDGGADMPRAAMTLGDFTEETSCRSDANINDGKPHMVAVIVDGPGKKLRFFIDGKEQGSAESLGDNTLEKIRGNNHWLGRSSYTDDRGLTGTIQELRIFNTALTADDITAHHKAGAAEIDAAKADAAKK